MQHGKITPAGPSWVIRATDGHGMSALPPIATELLRRTELTLRAISYPNAAQQTAALLDAR